MPVVRAAAQAAGGVALLYGSWRAVRDPRLQQVDVRAGDAIRWFGTPALDVVAVNTTDLGSIYAVGGAAACLAATGRRRAAADVLGVGIAAWNLSQANKRRVRRQRPFQAQGVRRLIKEPTGSSFPSGHAAVGAAVFSVLAHHAVGRPLRRRVFGALTAYVPVTRVYVGVHYPTDVLGGAGMGLAIAALWRGPVAAAGRVAVVAAARGLGRLWTSGAPS